MKKITAILTLAIVGLALIVCEQGEKKVHLRFKYKPQMRLTYEQLAKGNIVVHAGDSIIRERTNEITTSLDQYVRRIVDDSTAEIVENKSYRYKSFDRIDSTLTDTVHQGYEMILYIAPSGKVVDFEFTSEEAKASTAYLKNFYEQGMPVFPRCEISKGYSWTQTYKVVLEEEEMEASTTYEIKSFVREHGYDCVLIAYDGNLILPIKGCSSDTTLRYGIDRITASGLMYFAYKEGLVVLQQEHWLLDGNRHKVTNGKPEDYNITVEYDVNLTLKELQRP